MRAELLCGLCARDRVLRIRSWDLLRKAAMVSDFENLIGELWVGKRDGVMSSRKAQGGWLSRKYTGMVAAGDRGGSGGRFGKCLDWGVAQ